MRLAAADEVGEAAAKRCRMRMAVKRRRRRVGPDQQGITINHEEAGYEIER
ncbi:MAG TPA: hypothetical protein VJ373_03005 [Desulfatiglandales bacterium]|nr:hypothetical protein [Desulfatiglandales bacterium]